MFTSLYQLINNLIMKQKLSLLEVCKLPDVQIHSKTAFFKSIVNRESQQVIQMKDQIAGLSYTVKIIGVQGEEVGITSKRIPMKIKKVDQTSPKVQYVPVHNYLPHKSFYAHPLIPIRQEKEVSEKDSVGHFFDFTQKDTIKVEQNERRHTSFKMRTRSMANMRLSNKPKHLIQNDDQIGKIKGLKAPSNFKKKSFSGLLKECNKFTDEKINPLFHEENPFFKKIQKIRKIYPQAGRQTKLKIQRYDIGARQSLTSQSNSNFSRF